MIDHTGVAVSDYEKSRAFYIQALGAVGYALLVEFPAATTARRVCGRTITRITTGPSCSIRTDTTSRRCVTLRSE